MLGNGSPAQLPTACTPQPAVAAAQQLRMQSQGKHIVVKGAPTYVARPTVSATDQLPDSPKAQTPPPHTSASATLVNRSPPISAVTLEMSSKMCWSMFERFPVAVPSGITHAVPAQVCLCQIGRPFYRCQFSSWTVRAWLRCRHIRRRDGV